MTAPGVEGHTLHRLCCDGDIIHWDPLTSHAIMRGTRRAPRASSGDTHCIKYPSYVSSLDCLPAPLGLAMFLRRSLQDHSSSQRRQDPTLVLIGRHLRVPLRPIFLSRRTNLARHRVLYGDLFDSLGVPAPCVSFNHTLQATLKPRAAHDNVQKTVKTVYYVEVEGYGIGTLSLPSQAAIRVLAY